MRGMLKTRHLVEPAVPTVGVDPRKPPQCSYSLHSERQGDASNQSPHRANLVLDRPHRGSDDHRPRRLTHPFAL